MDWHDSNDGGGKFCPDCGARIDRGPEPPPPPHPAFDDVGHHIIVNVRRHVMPVPWKILCLLRRRYPNLARTAMLVRCLKDESYPEAMRVHINYLRKLLAGTQVSIETEWDQGYRLSYEQTPRRD